VFLSDGVELTPPSHISECRSKTMPPNTSTTGQLQQCKMANFNLDRMKNAKILAEKAIKVHLSNPSTLYVADHKFGSFVLVPVYSDY